MVLISLPWCQRKVHVTFVDDAGESPGQVRDGVAITHTNNDHGGWRHFAVARPGSAYTLVYACLIIVPAIIWHNNNTLLNSWRWMLDGRRRQCRRRRCYPWQVTHHQHFSTCGGQLHGTCYHNMLICLIKQVSTCVICKLVSPAFRG
jgi:hypothetical protein